MSKLFKRRRRGRFEAPERQTPLWRLPLFLWGALAFPELVLHVTTAGSLDLLLNSGLLLGPVFAVLPAMLMALLCTSLPRRWQNYICAVIYSLLSLLLCASQLVYYRIFGTFYTFFSMTNGAGAFQFAATIRTAIGNSILPILIMALPALYLLVMGLRHLGFQRHRTWKAKTALAALGIVIQIAAVVALPWLGGTEDTSAYGLYHNASDAYLGVNRLGLFTAFLLAESMRAGKSISRTLGLVSMGGSVGMVVSGGAVVWGGSVATVVSVGA